MIELVAYALTPVAAGAMLAIMLLSCVGVLMLAYALCKGVKTLYIKLRANLRMKRAMKRRNEQEAKVIRHG